MSSFAFLMVPALIASLVSCVTTVDIDLVPQPCTFSAWGHSVPSIILFSAVYSMEIKAALPATGFQSFFLPHNSLFFSSGFTLPDNGFQRIHSKFPIFNIRFSSLGNTLSLPTQSLGIDCTSRVASRSEGIIA